MNYYTNQCKNCGEDCDGEYCSWDCEQSWKEGYWEDQYQRQCEREDTSWAM